MYEIWRFLVLNTRQRTHDVTICRKFGEKPVFANCLPVQLRAASGTDLAANNRAFGHGYLIFFYFFWKIKKKIVIKKYWDFNIFKQQTNHLWYIFSYTLNVNSLWLFSIGLNPNFWPRFPWHQKIFHLVLTTIYFFF